MPGNVKGPRAGEQQPGTVTRRVSPTPNTDAIPCRRASRSMIFKQQKRKTYTVIDNGALRDPGLSFKATGLLAFLLSLPDNWRPNTRHLSSIKTDGRGIRARGDARAGGSGLPAPPEDPPSQRDDRLGDRRV